MSEIACPHTQTGLLGLAALMRMHLAQADMTPLYQQLLARAGELPEDADALLDAGMILQMHGQPALALQLQQEALRVQRHFRLPARRPVRLRLLALLAPGALMANVPIECLLEDSDIELNLYYATPGGEPVGVPEHDLLFVAVGQSAANQRVLDAWQPWLDAWPRPVVTDPQRIAWLARDQVSLRLAGQSGVLMPPNTRISRQALQAGAVTLPAIVRPVDSHAGNDLYRVENSEELQACLAGLPGDELYVAPFVDYRSADGQFRKYRVILVDGVPYACHMAISSHWMIHYLNAGMADDAAKRAEEAAWMAGFDTGFAHRHAAALQAIDAAFGMPYLGIDCAETADGRLLVFEVDHAMVVHAMDPLDRFAYKQPVMEKLFAAFRAMLYRAAARPAPGAA